MTKFISTNSLLIKLLVEHERVRNHSGRNRSFKIGTVNPYKLLISIAILLKMSLLILMIFFMIQKLSMFSSKENDFYTVKKAKRTKGKSFTFYIITSPQTPFKNIKVF